MRSKRITLTKEVQQEIGFSIERSINNIRLDWLREHAEGNHHDNIWRDNELNTLIDSLFADINSILGIE